MPRKAESKIALINDGDERVMADLLLESVPANETPGSMKSLELFMAPYTKPLGLKLFGQLVSLEIIACGLTSLEDIASLDRLQRLVACENEIEAIPAQLPPNLHTLDLRGNRIARVSHLAPSLSNLNLAENRLSSPEGVALAPHLRQLNLAANHIRSIGSELLQLRHLVEVNLSGNDLGDLDEIRQLQGLSRLRTLLLSDPHYGDNPVCSLCNYRTLLIHDLPVVDVLDAQHVTDTVRSAVQLVYTKKAMYYNMRMKAAKKAAADVIRQAKSVRTAFTNMVHMTLAVALRQLRDFEHELARGEFRALLVVGLVKAECVLVQGDNLAAPSSWQPYKDKCEALRELICSQHAVIDRIDSDFATFRQLIQSEVCAAIDRLEVEMRSGGNIRLEDGHQNHEWVAQVTSNFLARFDRDAFRDIFDIDRVHVTSVTRIHNRQLKLRFDQAVTHSEDSVGGVQLLVSVSAPEFESSHQTLLQGAQFGVGHDRDPGHTPRFRLSADLLFADRDRLAAITNCNARGRDQLFIMLARVASMNTDCDPLDSSYITLPEYLIEYRYERTQRPITDCDPVSSFVYFEENVVVGEPVDQPAITAVTPRSRYRHSPRLDAILHRFRAYWNPIQYAESDALQAEKIIGIYPVVPVLDQVFHEAQKIAADECTILEQARILGLCGAVDPCDAAHTGHWSAIPYLDLHGHRIESMSAPDSVLHRLTRLRILVLSFNRIRGIDGLGDLVHLVHLDLGHNHIERIAGLDGLHQLKRLYLNNNRLCVPHDLDHVRQHCPALDVLDLRHNPAAFPVVGTSGPVALDWDVIRQGLVLRTDHCATDKAHLVEEAVTLSLDHVPIESLGPLKEWTFPAVKVVSVCHCLLTSLDGLGHLSRLEAVTADDNLICDMRSISGIVPLKRLELNSNRIAFIQGLEAMSGTLVELSLDCNLIKVDALAGLAPCVSLTELYLSGNQIGDLVAVLRYLRPLSSLVVLDLADNPVCSEPQYRLATIFHVKKLKILDGCGVTSAEVDACKDEFEGRVTDEFLADWLEAQHQACTSTDCLDLSGAQIRAFDPIQPDRFQSIVQVNLENNQLTRVEVLAGLSSLSTLNLGRNRITSIADGAWAALGCTLQVLLLGSNRIASVADLHLGYLPALHVLDLRGNEIRSLSGAFLGNNLIRELNLSDNLIGDVHGDDLRGLCGLRVLNISGNALRNLNGVCSVLLTELHLQCPRILTLACSGNRISSLTDLEMLARIPTLTDLTLGGNPVARKHLYRTSLLQACPTLRCLDGRDVTDADRARIASLFEAHAAVVLQPCAPFIPMPMRVESVAASAVPYQYGSQSGSGGGVLVSQYDPNAPFAVRSLMNTRRVAVPSLARSPRRLSLVAGGRGAGSTPGGPGWKRIPGSQRTVRGRTHTRLL